MAQNCATVRPEAGKRASRSSRTSRVAARERTVRVGCVGARTASDMGNPPRVRATPRRYPSRQERDLPGAYPEQDVRGLTGQDQPTEEGVQGGLAEVLR